MAFNVKSIAIIGVGPSGITALYDLSRLTKDGKTLFGEKDISKYEEEGNVAFPEIVAFERNSSIGGVWCKTASGENNTDPNLPELDGGDTDDVDLTDPETVYQYIPINEDLESKLKRSSVNNPVQVPFTDHIDRVIRNQWRSSAAYDGLFTNITNRYMAFSFHERMEDVLKKMDTKYKHLPEFQSAMDVANYLEEVVKDNNLEKYIRLNSNVERVKKLENGKWEVIISVLKEENGKKTLNWYKQCFDGVIISNGKTVPIVPNIKNLTKFAEVNKDKVQFCLAKSVKNPSFLRNAKKPLIIGASISSVDIIQYAFPRDVENPSIYLSRRSEVSKAGWPTLLSYAKGIINKPMIEEFLPESNYVRFSDGSLETGFDVIIMCTGYHIHLPFIDKSVLDSKPDALNFFKYTFSMGDPTLSLVGNTYGVFFFNRVESQSAAIAGIWSNQTELPSLEEQIEHSKNVISLIPPKIDQNFITPLMKLAVQGRPHPFSVNKEKSDHVYHHSRGTNNVMDLFFQIRNGEVNIDDIFL